MASLKDVARLAGVSIRTVTRALQDEEGVSSATRAKILEIVKETGYRPNLAARSLKSGKSQEICAVLGEINSSHRDKLVAFEKRIAQESYYINISLSPSEGSVEERCERVVESVLRHYPAAVALFPMLQLPYEILAQSFIEMNVPYIVIDPQKSYPNLDKVRIDRNAGVRAAVRHFASLGRTYIAYVGPPTDPWSRMQGYLDGIEEAGLSPIPIETDWLCSWDVGREAAEKIVKMDPMPDAVVAYADSPALGIMSGLFDHKLRVPEDVAIVGFGDVDFAKFSWPKLASIAQPKKEMGVAAAEMLLDKIRTGRVSYGGRKIAFPARFVARESAG